MKNKWLFTAFVLAALCLVLSGCDSGGSNEPDPGDQTQKYTLTVSGGIIGEGGAVTTGRYEANEKVPINADAAPAGEIFFGWASSETGAKAGTFANAGNASTTFTMPAADVTLTTAYVVPAGPNLGANNQAYKNIGVYLYENLSNNDDNDRWYEWLNFEAPARYFESFNYRTSWSNDNRIEWRKAWRKGEANRKLVISYAPFPNVDTSWNGGADTEEARTRYQKAAAGEYNGYYRQFGQWLKTCGFPDAIIRFGHEMNGNWYAYSINVGTASAIREKQSNFAKAFRQFAETLREIPDTDFVFCWNPNCSDENASLIASYPGDDYVDVIGFDQYDHSLSVYKDANPSYHDSTDAAYRAEVQQRAWNAMVRRSGGMNWFATFAKQHNKPLSIPEWGLWEGPRTRGGDNDGGDNPVFIENMFKYINANNVEWHIYFMDGDVSHSLYREDLYPQAIAKFKELWVE